MDENPDLSRFVNVHDFEAAATARLTEASREYLNSGSADEITLRHNRRAFEETALLPRVLRDVSRIDTSLELFGTRLLSPLMIAPTGYHRLFHPEGEIATARGAASSGTPYVVSSMATVAIEDIVAAAPEATLWFQLYVQRDEGRTLRLIERAEAAGCRALAVTVDTPVLGSRDRERRLAFPTDGTMSAVHLEGLSPSDPKSHHWEPGSIYSPLLQPALTWESIAWIRAHTRLPVLLKGVMAAEDARLAVTAGVDGLIVSNHGGRNLDTAPATLDVLPGIVSAAGGRMPVLIDGGIRRGTDALKALALGAQAVMVGRPPLWGLAVAGAEGVARVMELLQAELLTAMALAGVTRLADIDSRLIWRGRAGMEDA
jgi:4-hydroxymandelate oxidase